MIYTDFSYLITNEYFMMGIFYGFLFCLIFNILCSFESFLFEIGHYYRYKNYENSKKYREERKAKFDAWKARLKERRSNKQ